MPDRRTLMFQSLDQVMPDVDHLMAGYTVVGRWSLGQICNHLTLTMIRSIEGFPSRTPWPVRMTLGRAIKTALLRSGKMAEGIKATADVCPRPLADDRAEAEALRAALRVYAAHAGPVSDHPLMGRMSQADWTRLHCIHAAHHLSFVWPKA